MQGDGHSSPYLAFYMGTNDPNSGHDVCKAGVSPAESFLSPVSTKRLAFTILLEKSKCTFNSSLQEFLICHKNELCYFSKFYSKITL